MSEDKGKIDLNGWFPTYGLITARRIFDRYRLKLTDEELLYALEHPACFFHHLLQVPLKNVYNGIILDQVRSYQIYAQKLFVDYLISGEGSKLETAPGGVAREELEIQRQELVLLNDSFHEQELAHDTQIAHSQRAIINSAEHWQQHFNHILGDIKQHWQGQGLSLNKDTLTAVFTHLVVHYDLSKNNLDSHSWQKIEKMYAIEVNQQARSTILDSIQSLIPMINQIEEDLQVYLSKAREIKHHLLIFRKQFYEFIARVSELLLLLPDYKQDGKQVDENRISLLFDRHLGEEQY